jgi:hypothetical protein
MLNLRLYETSRHERAIYKNIPIQCLPLVQAHLKKAKAAGQLGRCLRVRYRFRGPRFDTNQRYTRKQHAHSFSVYQDYAPGDRARFACPMIWAVEYPTRGRRC